MKQKKIRVKDSFFDAIIALICLAIIILGVSAYFMDKVNLIGPAFLVIGFLNLLVLKFFKINLKSVYPDMVFGFIDNGVLIFTAILGGAYAGVFGAIIGGAAGNAMTDGIGGLFEGYVAQNQREFEVDNNRTPLSTMLGKVAGCLFGAGIGLVIVSIFKFLF